MNNTVFVAITMDSDEPLRIMGFLCYGRATTLPFGAVWTTHEGYFAREPTEANISHEVNRSCPIVGFAGVPLPRPVSWRIVSEAEISTLNVDRTYRDALHDDGATLHHHMGKAREIHRTKLRRHRELAFAKLDVAYHRADETGDTAEKQRITAAKQALRDVTAHPAIDAAQTTAALKAIWPKELG